MPMAAETTSNSLIPSNARLFNVSQRHVKEESGWLHWCCCWEGLDLTTHQKPAHANKTDHIPIWRVEKERLGT
jgi:hypothetical protein